MKITFKTKSDNVPELSEAIRYFESGFLDELTTDKKHYTEVLLRYAKVTLKVATYSKYYENCMREGVMPLPLPYWLERDYKGSGGSDDTHRSLFNVCPSCGEMVPSERPDGVCEECDKLPFKTNRDA